ncbi:MAG TPA: hypothetical protein VGC97_25200 [Pyrinomonadaceae bacterium]|jgi:hypothetical protein
MKQAFEIPAEAFGCEEIRLAAFRRIRDEIRDYFENDFVKILETE